MLLSSAVDMEVTGESFDTNRDKDPFFRRELVRGIIGGFLGEAGDPRDPLVNPLRADLTGLGPLYIQVGGDETLLDDARQLEARARNAGAAGAAALWAAGAQAILRTTWKRRDLAALFCAGNGPPDFPATVPATAPSIAGWSIL